MAARLTSTARLRRRKNRSADAERRQAPRASGRVLMAVTRGGEAFQAETKNLSTLGVYCEFEHFVPPMTKLQLQFELPNGLRQTAIRCAGVVVRVEPVVTNPGRGFYRIAVFFTDLSERYRSAIDRFVRQRVPSTQSHR